MNLVIAAFTIALILSLLAMGMLISFRMIRFTDITVDGSITLGAAVAAVMLVQGWNPWIATFAAFVAGMLAGTITGLLFVRFRIQMILSGILMMTALYSVNLRIMGRSNIPLLDTPGVSGIFETLLGRMLAGATTVNVAGWQLTVYDLSVLLSSLFICVLAGLLLTFFLKTHLGTALRATGNNPQMVRAQGVNNNAMVVLGLALSNGLVGLSGGLLAQYQGFVDVQMGIGMMVWGLASIILGEALVGRRSIGLIVTSAVLGTIVFRLLIAIALRWGLNPNDLRLVTALFVLIALVVPHFMKNVNFARIGGKRHAAGKPIV